MRRATYRIGRSRAAICVFIAMLLLCTRIQNAETLTSRESTNAKSSVITLTQKGVSNPSPIVAQDSDTPVAPPANDNFANAMALGAETSFMGTSVDATKEAGEPNHAGNTGGHSVWFKMLTTSHGSCLDLRSIGTNFDTLVAVYTGLTVNALTLVASNDDYGDQLKSFVCMPLTAGVTYYIAVDGFAGDSGFYLISEGFNRLFQRSSRFSGTGMSDAVTVFRPSSGTWYTNSSNGFQYFHWGQNGDIPVPADYDGDFITDYAVFRPANGTWYVWRSQTNTLRQLTFGQSGDQPVRGDYDGDGYSDFAVFRPSNGTWYISSSRTGVFSFVQFGQNGDKPVPDHYDGDARLDIAVFRPSNSTWYIRSSINGAVTGQQWGASTDIPLPGEYGGFTVRDGKSDIAVWRPANGTWYVLKSIDGQLAAFAFGQSGDIPQPVDRQGFGNYHSYCVFRPGNGTWYMQDSFVFQAIQFGANGDIPASTFYLIQP